MLTVAEVDQLLNKVSMDRQTEKINVVQSVGRYLSEPVLSNGYSPNFDTVCMDGYAIHISALENRNKFILQKKVFAGQHPGKLDSKSHAIEVMTGSPLPDGTNVVIPYEYSQINSNTVSFTPPKKCKKGWNIQEKGSFFSKGDLLFSQKSKIKPLQLSVLMDQHIEYLNVLRPPKVSVISIGDELVDEKSKGAKIFSSNSISIIQLLKQWSIPVLSDARIPDELDTLCSTFKEFIAKSDILITCGGLSKGLKDFTRKGFKKSGVKELVYEVDQKPGKPFYFGTYKNKLIFGLTGNPVPNAISLRRFIIPCLMKRMGVKLLPPLKCNFKFEPKEFKRNSVYILCNFTFSKNGKFTLDPIESFGSGDFFTVSNSTGFMEVSKEDPLHSYYYSWEHNE